MKRRKNQHRKESMQPQKPNPVAKFAHQFNKSHCFSDKSKYRRNAKHKRQEASLMALFNKIISEVTCSPSYFDENLPQFRITAKPA
ncbi:MAG: hypothetical protein K9L60_00880 [Methylovulum sp.]|jgi:hypothetical protein|nr:hypothetical protein [Methylovulum sp.]MCF7997577.1 hypothetical protein [Methylovulum sp.]